jgi:hypothetical protein
MRAIFLIACLWCSEAFADQHWITGAWDCRSWGAVRFYEEPYRYAVDVDPDGNVNNWGYWQDFDENSILVVWMNNNSMDMFSRMDGKVVFQTMYSFGVSNDITETKKILKKDFANE